MTKQSGHLYCWGAEQAQNRAGSEFRPRIVKPADLDPYWNAVAAGTTHTCGRFGHDQVWCWENGALAQRVNLPFDPVTAIEAGDGHACALGMIGDVPKLACWGNDSRRQAGGGTIDNPTIMDSFGRVSEVAAGTERTCVLSENSVKCVGKPLSGETTTMYTVTTMAAHGLSANFDQACWIGAGDAVQCVPKPPPQAITATRVTTGRTHACASKANDITCWDAAGNITRHTLPLMVVEITAGDDFTCAAAEGGGVFCWGANDHGELGIGPGSASEPAVVEAPCP